MLLGPHFITATNTAPQITCPATVTVQSLANNIGNFATWTDATCTDLEQADDLLITSCSEQSGSFFNGVQSNSVTCTCRDNGNLISACTFNVIIEPVEGRS